MKPLYSRRRRLRELAEREAAGETFWTSEFDTPVRVKVRHAIADMTNHEVAHPSRVARVARRIILRDEGLLTLTGLDEEVDFLNYLDRVPNEDFPSCIEAIHEAMGIPAGEFRTGTLGHQALFAYTIQQILAEHRVAFELIDGEMIPFESKELHTEVVVPTLQLLSGRTGWGAVEDAYQKALEEIPKDPGDAITDVARALEEALRLLGCSGNSLGKLIADAKRQGLLGPYDSKLSDGVEKIMEWVSAERGEKSDAHAGEDGLRDDAWLAVHIVGALILRLASGAPRADR